MKFHILTLFPDIFESVFSKSIIKRTIDRKILKIEYINIRDYGLGKHKQVDDKPFGGGKGMVMMVEPIAKALSTVNPKPYTILLSASGKKFDQALATKLSKQKNLALICGHYEGIDARVENIANDTISVGDFILTGGEIPAMFVIDVITRLLPGSINPLSPQDESFDKGLLEYPQYTRPQTYQGLKVPKILQSGNHQKILNWRKSQSLKRTKKYRPDLLK